MERGQDQAQVTEASLFVVMTADLASWKKDTDRYWHEAPQKVQEMMVPMIDSFYEGKEQLQRDEAMRSCGIAAQTIMLAAKTMGYDSCPMIGFDPQKVAQIISLPDDHVVAMLLVVGKSLKPARPRGGQLPLEEVVVYDRFEGSGPVI